MSKLFRCGLLLAACITSANYAFANQNQERPNNIILTSPIPIPKPVADSCIALASSVYNVPQFAIKVVLKVEGGKIGTISKNSNNTFDLGPMQLNSSNLHKIKEQFPYLDWTHITYDPCINIMVGSWWLSNRIKDRDGDVWAGIGDYHSRTPVYHERYLNLAKKAYQKILNDEQNSLLNKTAANRPMLATANNDTGVHK